MTTSTAISAQGTIVQIENNASPGEYVTINNVKSFSDLEGGSAGEIDVTDMTSTAKEFLVGLRDNGSVTLNVLHRRNDPGQMMVEDRREDGAVTGFKFTLPTLDVATFNGLVKKFSKSGGVDQAVAGSIEIRVTGDVTWA